MGHTEELVDARRVSAQAGKAVEEDLGEGPPARCTVTTRQGRPCRRPALEGHDACALHTLRGSRPGGERSPGRPPPGDDGRGRPAPMGVLEERVREFLARLESSGILREGTVGHLMQAVREALGTVVPGGRERLSEGLERLLGAEVLDPGMWKGALYVLRNYVEGRIEQSRRRGRGDYEVDPYGMDEDFLHGLRGLAHLVYKYWFRVTPLELTHVPDEGRGLLVANHSGVLPWDGAMISEAIFSEHPSPRFVRWLFLKWFATLPFVAPLLARTGCVLGSPENGVRLLEEGQLAGVFPEGLKGVGKLFKDRYRLARFGRGGFIQIAMRTRAPIVPVSVVGAEEIYPALAYLDVVSKPLGLPYLPITPTFPWLGALGFIPLPTRWSIHFGKPLRFTEKAPELADNFLVVSLLTERVRQRIQDQIFAMLAQRRSIF